MNNGSCQGSPMSGQPNQEVYLQDQIRSPALTEGHEAHSFTASPAAFSLTNCDLRPSASEKFEVDSGLCSNSDQPRKKQPTDLSLEVSDYRAASD